MSKRITTTELQTQISQQDATIEYLQEQLSAAMLELAIEDGGWRRLTSQAIQEFSKSGIDRIAEISRLLKVKNPLIKRGVSVQADYVFGQGFSIQARHNEINKAIQGFIDHPKNALELFGHQACLDKDKELACDGNVFLVLFTRPLDGHVCVRSIPPYQIVDVISDPEDSKCVWYYERQWNQRGIDGREESKRAYYPHWQYSPASKTAEINSYPVYWDAPIYHIKVGSFSDWRWGISEVYAAIDWARAYKEFLEDWATLSRAYSRFAHKLTTPGGKTAVAAARNKLATTLSMTSGETNPPPGVGSTAVLGQGFDLSAIKIGGANVSSEDGRRLMLMVAAALNIPETFFGDASVGTLATARSLDRPTQLAMGNRQTFWATVYTDILSYVLLWQVKAPRGALRAFGRVLRDEDREYVEWRNDSATNEPINATIDVTFPPIVEIDLTERASAINTASTIIPDQRIIARLILSALGVDNIDELIDEMFADYEVPITGKAAQDAIAQQGQPNDTQKPAPNEAKQTGGTAND